MRPGPHADQHRHTDAERCSKKSLKGAGTQAADACRHAAFHVTSIAVVGGGVAESGGRAGDRAPRRRVGLHFDGRHHSRLDRQLRPLSGESSEVLLAMKKLENPARKSTISGRHFHGRPHLGSAAPAARYLYVVRGRGWCTTRRSKRGFPAKLLDEYTVEEHPATVSRESLARLTARGLRAPEFPTDDFVAWRRKPSAPARRHPAGPRRLLTGGPDTIALEINPYLLPRSSQNAFQS